eukprot:Skav226242  [mRNA]  locus=scaffold1218:522540:537094:- [translate_table: standard]
MPALGSAYPGALPRSLFLAPLRHLDVTGNRLRELPEMGQVPLETLRVANNQLVALPKSLGHLTQLKQKLAELRELLQLGSAALRRSQPEPPGDGAPCVADVPTAALGLAGNDLVELPSSFRDLRKLTEVHLSGEAAWKLGKSWKVPENLVKWRWAPAVDRAPRPTVEASGAASTAAPRCGERGQAAAAAAEAAARTPLAVEQRPCPKVLEISEDEKGLATRVFQWLQEVKGQLATTCLLQLGGDVGRLLRGADEEQALECAGTLDEDACLRAPVLVKAGCFFSLALAVIAGAHLTWRPLVVTGMRPGGLDVVGVLIDAAVVDLMVVLLDGDGGGVLCRLLLLPAPEVLSLKAETRLHLVLRSPWPAFRMLDLLARLIPQSFGSDGPWISVDAEPNLVRPGELEKSEIG